MTPRVSVIIPSYNEAQTMPLLLEALIHQTTSDFEVINADGMSDDGTQDAVREFAVRHPEMDIKIVENLDRTIPAGLNLAISESKGEFVIRLDAHSIPASDYIERCLEVQQATVAANVGGIWKIRPSGDGWIARSIAQAAAHQLAAGDARYRTGGKAGEVDTVPFGAFPIAWLEKIGGYDENLLTNEDYELNVRLRKAGGTVWFDPAIQSTYLARKDLGGLVRQYFRYGFWKARTLRLHPGSLRLRQILPPLFVWATVVLGLLGLYVPLAWTLLTFQWVTYAVALLAAGVVEAIRRLDALLIIGVPLSIATIHLSWGLGFWWSLLFRRSSKQPGSVNG